MITEAELESQIAAGIKEPTPGPWFAVKKKDSECWMVLDPPNGGLQAVICELGYSAPNAYLTAAAPDLYAALCEVAILGHGKCTIGKPLADMVLAALAKAKGDAQ